MKFILFLPLLLLMFAGATTPQDLDMQDNQAISENIGDINSISADETESTYLDFQAIREITFAETGSLNVFIWPNLRPEAKVSHEATSTGFYRTNTVKNKLLS